MEKILQLGELFGVTLDYLLKDERETEETTGTVAETSVRRVTLAEANEFLAWRERASIRIAAGVFLCILAVVPLLLLAAWAEYSPTGISEELAGVGGLMILLMKMCIRDRPVPAQGKFLKALHRLVKETKPQVILSTLPLCTRLASEYKGRYGGFQLISCVTDIRCHSEWIAPHVDLYCVPSQKTFRELVKKGIDPQDVYKRQEHDLASASGWTQGG